MWVISEGTFPFQAQKEILLLTDVVSESDPQEIEGETIGGDTNVNLSLIDG